MREYSRYYLPVEPASNMAAPADAARRNSFRIYCFSAKNRSQSNAFTSIEEPYTCRGCKLVILGPRIGAAKTSLTRNRLGIGSGGFTAANAEVWKIKGQRKLAMDNHLEKSYMLSMSD